MSFLFLAPSFFLHHRLSLETEEDKGTEFITAASDLVSCIPVLFIFMLVMMIFQFTSIINCFSS